MQVYNRAIYQRLHSGMTTDADFTGIATEALSFYGMQDAQLTRLGGIDNTNFRVDAGAEAYALHLYAARHDHTAIASEFVWLGSLRRDAGLTVPEPVPNRAGELVSRVMHGETEKLCTLTRWLEGKIPPTIDAMTPEQLAQTGVLMAHLHAHANEFEAPGVFNRSAFDEAYFRSCLNKLYEALRRTGLDKGDLEQFKANAEIVFSHFGSLTLTKSSFGLVHGDFHSGNYLLDSGAVSIIDFGRCGFGFYLYDLALALMEMVDEQRLSFLKGYQTVKPLPDGYMGLNETFLALAYLDNLSTLAENPEELPFIVADMPLVLKAFERAVATCK